MPDLQRFNDVLSLVSYPEFKFIVTSQENSIYMQIECLGKCNVTSKPYSWKGRKWFLSVHMTDGEIVQTAFKAVLTALEHEARENFKYRDVTIFDPHYDIERLVDLRKNPDSIKEREPLISSWTPCRDCIFPEDCGSWATCMKHPSRSQSG